ncbi:hypothetical protein PV733_18605 [Streptomyces europaeiscabiei]|nr:hypothetical protein [Streptomyces europaeiscabiei]MDX3667115.1 hypothetical protein [Streptomyces europaeiscabiei]MDX3710935.1 hypothetical protein [Streptomyces europaeiscabiei]MDX3863085.1 hypothetical protein [Streptomyces europaeiscabiei]MDX3871823.1 hypothetical protein [Streptomyces europaeiscabiei]
MPTAVRSAGDAGSKVKVVTFDLHQELEGATVKGDIEFVVDRQSHRQGYLLPVSRLAVALQSNGTYTGGGERPVLTGPALRRQGRDR